MLVPRDKCVSMYDVKNGMLIKDLRGHFTPVRCCLFHPTDVVCQAPFPSNTTIDAPLFALEFTVFFQEMYSGSGDDEVLVWDPVLPEHLQQTAEWES